MRPSLNILPDLPGCHVYAIRIDIAALPEHIDEVLLIYLQSTEYNNVSFQWFLHTLSIYWMAIRIQSIQVWFIPWAVYTIDICVPDGTPDSLRSTILISQYYNNKAKQWDAN